MTFQAFSPIEYLKIDVATNHGLDKEDWDVRINWFDANETELLELAQMTDRREIETHPLLVSASEPGLFFAGLKAWEKARRGEAISYPVSLDATASGAQLLAVLVGCEKSARHCNVVDTGHRQDLYTNAYHGMLGRMGLQGSAAVISRDDVKAAVMPSFYGSKAMPKKVFGEDEQLSIFYQTMDEDFTGIWELNQGLLGLWQSSAFSHDWVLPDNFHVKTKTMDEREEYVQFLGRPVKVVTKVNQPTPEGRSLGANIIHSLDGMVVREMSRRCSYDVDKILNLMELLTSEIHYRPIQKRPQDQLVATLWAHYQETGFLSARILELLDEDNLLLVEREVIRQLILSLPETPFQVLSVHDCFRVHPNYGNDLRRQYNQVLYEISKSSILESIAGQITGEKITVQKYQDISSQILETNYALS